MHWTRLLIFVQYCQKENGKSGKIILYNTGDLGYNEIAREILIFPG